MSKKIMGVFALCLTVSASSSVFALSADQAKVIAIKAVSNAHKEAAASQETRNKNTHPEAPHIQKASQAQSDITQAFAAGHAKGFVAGMKHAQSVVNQATQTANHPAVRQAWYERVRDWANKEYDHTLALARGLAQAAENKASAAYNTATTALEKGYDETLAYLNKVF